jgi:endoglucanase
MRAARQALVVLLSLAAFTSYAGDDPSTAVRVDQIGYPLDAIKVAVVVTDSPTGKFTVNRIPGGETVFEGLLAAPVEARDSRDRVRVADFSAVKAEGTYELRVGGAGRSATFQIRERPYRDILRLVTRSYYGQRCGTAVDLGPDFPEYKHEACHLSGAYHASSGRKGEHPSMRGWHDAGDYGRYVVNSGISTGTLLWAWELFPASLRDLDLAIPESGNDVPDILDEIRWNLDWMLTMQDGDGGVWHKETSEDFAPVTTAPDKDALTSFVIGTGSEPFKSSCATGEFASTMAIAARVYAPIDEVFAARARDAALKAWAWLEKHPNVRFRNPRRILTGEYGDPDCSDERLWAAAEIWRTTGDEAIEKWFVAHSDGAFAAIVPGDPPDWSAVGAMAAWTYALSGKGEPAIISSIRDRSVRAAASIVARSRSHGYRIPLETDDYVWGSNGVAANYGLQLLVANELQADPSYREAALEIVHYLLGRNPFSISWVTGAGWQPVMHPHHAPSASDEIEAPWPGLLAGGPNRNRQDEAMRKLPRGTPPGRMYLDQLPSYATNENAINWNAPLVFVLAGLSE